MKKSLMLVANILLVISLVSCAKYKRIDNDVYFNKKFDDKTMVTIDGTETSIENSRFIFGSKKTGMLIKEPESWEKVNKYLLDVYTYPFGVSVSYIPESVFLDITSKDFSQMSEQDAYIYLGNALSNAFEYAICFVSTDQTKDLLATVQSRFENVDLIAKVKANSYYVAYNSTMPDKNYSETDKAAINTLISNIDNLKNSMILYTPIEPKEQKSQISLSNFSAETISGKTVNQDMLKDYDVTMVNVWTTWCGFCVQEMPELAKLYKQLPDNVNMITIAGDADTEKELATEILSDSNAEFESLIINDQLKDSVLRYITGFPTTFFVDKKGNLVGKVQSGLPGRDVIAGYNALIEEALSQVK